MALETLAHQHRAVAALADAEPETCSLSRAAHLLCPRAPCHVAAQEQQHEEALVAGQRDRRQLGAFRYSDSGRVPSP